MNQTPDQTFAMLEAELREAALIAAALETQLNRIKATAKNHAEAVHAARNAEVTYPRYSQSTAHGLADAVSVKLRLASQQFLYTSNELLRFGS